MNAAKDCMMNVQKEPLIMCGIFHYYMLNLRF